MRSNIIPIRYRIKDTISMLGRKYYENVTLEILMKRRGANACNEGNSVRIIKSKGGGGLIINWQGDIGSFEARLFLSCFVCFQDIDIYLGNWVQDNSQVWLIQRGWGGGGWRRTARRESCCWLEIRGDCHHSQHTCCFLTRHAASSTIYFSDYSDYSPGGNIIL